MLQPMLEASVNQSVAPNKHLYCKSQENPSSFSNCNLDRINRVISS